MLSRLPPDRERLVKVLERLRPLTHAGVCLSQIVQRVCLAGAAAGLLQIRRQRIIQIFQSLQLPQIAQLVFQAEHLRSALRVADGVPDRQRVVQVLQRLFPLPQVVMDPPSIGQGVGFGRSKPQ